MHPTHKFPSSVEKFKLTIAKLKSDYNYPKLGLAYFGLVLFSLFLVLIISNSHLLGLKKTSASASSDSVQGVLTFIHGDDFVNKKEVDPHYAIIGKNNSQTRVNFDKTPSKYLLGKTVKLSGLKATNQTFNAQSSQTQIAAPTNTASFDSSHGDHKVAIILFNFSDNATQPYTSSFANGVAFTNSNSVADFYKVNSGGQINLSGDVYGWYTLPTPASSSICDTYNWAVAATKSAALNGFDPANYNNVVFAFPYTTACKWGGTAYMPGKWSWLNGPNAMTLPVMAHELGHNFGTNHASEYNCKENGVAVPLSSNPANCSLNEYGDPFSLMGNGSYEHTNFSRGNYSWLADANTYVAGASGTYTIAPVENPGTAVSSLMIPRDANNDFDLEYRRPDKYDNWATSDVKSAGILIRLTPPSYTTLRESWLINVHPKLAVYKREILKPGETFTDPQSGISITTVSVSAAGAVVKVINPNSTSTPTPTPTPSPTPTLTPTPTPSADTTLPSVTITNPLDGASLAVNSVITISANATDNVGVTKVGFYVNGTIKCTDKVAPYTCKWTIGSTKNTTYTILVRAFDAANNIGKSTITVKSQ